MNIIYFGYKKSNYAFSTLKNLCANDDIHIKFFNIDELSFYNGTLTKNQSLIRLEKYDAAIVRCHDKIFNKVSESKRITAYQIVILLRDHNVLTLNGTFFRRNPFFDKFSQSILFAKNDIPSIPTIYPVSTQIMQKDVFIPWDFPLIIKEINGSFGISVYKMNSLEKLLEWISKNPKKKIIIQKFIPNTCDYRIIVCGQKTLGIMKRSSVTNGWKHNFSQGATIELHRDDRMARFGEDIAQKLKCDYVGIDIIIDSNGDYLVVEINLSANFKGFETVHGMYTVSKNIIETLQKKEHLLTYNTTYETVVCNYWTKKFAKHSGSL